MHTLLFIPDQKIQSKAVDELIHFLQSKNKKTKVFLPVSNETGGLSSKEITRLFSEGKLETAIEKIISAYSKIFQNEEVAVLIGLPLTQEFPFAAEFNTQLAQTFDAGVIVEKSNAQKLIEKLYDTARILDAVNLEKSLDTFFKKTPRLSANMFRYQLIEKSKAARKHIILPEGDEPRTIKAANICAEKQIAKVTLLGDEKAIQKVLDENKIKLHEKVNILNPKTVYKNYMGELVELRKAKGMTLELAEKELQDNVMLGTMMLHRNEVDGLVSGAVHSTANTIRPALQIIKTTPCAKLVSSIFFMCLPDQVLVYGDCAVNPNPTIEELADIAIQSSDSANTFGIPARTAMISYSTGTSGAGPDVQKVFEATELAKKLRPDLLVDGPLQYDAASVESVGKQKAPNSPVAGCATVFIFPDLNTGNTTYKAVQRSADILSIGPMLQGMKKPVNDLSRGALVEDIVFTIALTAIQATQEKK